MKNIPKEIVTIEYLDKNDNCKSATGAFDGFCDDGDVIIIDNKLIRRKGMPVHWH